MLPLKRDIDDGYFTIQVQNEFARKGGQSGYKVYTREDEAMKKLLGEIEWNLLNEDEMDPETIQKFGSISGVEGVVLSRVDVSRSDLGVVSVRANMQVFEVETTRMLWGGERKGEGTPQVTVSQMKTIAMYVGIGIAALIVLVIVLRMIKAASRPR